ncbi:MAG: hotdog domain-containing protein [Tistlia sp.]|uniref:thioesterase family protein n=1 Tax=Tistlia sp. TaxID=3057121 RepID=UPI0034A34D38
MIEAGATERRTVRVDEQRTIGFMGPELRVYATPAIVADVEMACRDLLLGALEPGYDSVGTRVEIDHLAAARLGAEVNVEVTVTEASDRRVSFAATVRGGDTLLAEVVHQRAVVSVERLKQRIARL